MEKGAGGVMVEPLAGLNTEVKVLGYYEQVCKALGPDVPLVYQDYPQITGVPVSVQTLNTLIDRHPQLVMLKHEESPGLAKITALRQSAERSEEHTYELQSLMRISYAVACLKKKKTSQ